MDDLYIIDTDISLGTPRAEIDDGAALICLRRALGDQALAITTVHGNVGAEAATWNAQRICSYLDWDVPVFRGAESPLHEDPAWFAGWQAGYGPTPPWPEPPAEGRAADAIIDLVRANPGRVSLIAIGPLTNLALALNQAPEIAGMVREVICMGGGFNADRPSPEFNLRSDPEAAQIVLGASWPRRIFGLEVTRQLYFSRQDFEALPDGNPAVELLKKQAPGWINRVEEQGWESGGCSLHDAVPVAAQIDGSLIAYKQATVRVALAAPEIRGLALLEEGSGVQVAMDMELEACRELVFGLLKRTET